MKKIILNSLSVGMFLISTFASAADTNLECSVKYRFDRRDEWKVEKLVPAKDNEVVHVFSHENFSVNASLTKHGNVSTLVTIKGEDVLSLDSIGATIAFVPNDAGSKSEATTYRLLMKGGLSYILNCTKAEKSVEAIIEN